MLDSNAYSLKHSPSPKFLSDNTMQYYFGVGVTVVNRFLEHSLYHLVCYSNSRRRWIYQTSIKSSPTMTEICPEIPIGMEVHFPILHIHLCWHIWDEPVDLPAFHRVIPFLLTLSHQIRCDYASDNSGIPILVAFNILGQVKDGKHSGDYAYCLYRNGSVGTRDSSCNALHSTCLLRLVLSAAAHTGALYLSESVLSMQRSSEDASYSFLVPQRSARSSLKRT